MDVMNRTVTCSPSFRLHELNTAQLNKSHAPFLFQASYALDDHDSEISCASSSATASELAQKETEKENFKWSLNTIRGMLELYQEEKFSFRNLMIE